MNPPEYLGGFRLGSLLGRGQHGAVYAVDDHWVIKIVVVQKSGKARISSNLLFYENTLYVTRLNHLPGVPRRRAYGEKDGYRFLVVERMSRSILDDFQDSGCQWPASTIFTHMRDVLTILRGMHAKRMVYADLKPEHCMLDREDRLRLVDFGCTQVLFGIPGKNSVGGGGVGTPLYSSVNSHTAGALSPSDDLESLGYLMVWFFRGGHLPWENATSDEECVAIKKRSARSLCNGLPEGVARFFAEAAQSPPDYDRLLRCL